MSSTSIDQRVRSFKAQLLVKSALWLLQNHITFGEAFVFEDDRSRYVDFKIEIAEQFHIHPSEVVLVGSAKLGFSIAPKKRYQSFGDKSDIDVAIICPPLFEQIWQEVLEYWNNDNPWSQEASFKDYLFRGWIRPDKLPPADRFEVRKRWWNFFGNLTRTRKYGNYSVTGALYKSWHFFETYQRISIQQCQEEQRLGKLS